MSNRFAAVFACRRQVSGLDDDEGWRDFLARHIGKRSLRDMDGAELGRVLAALHAAGAPSAPPRPARAVGPNDGTVGKLRALWLSAYWLGVVDNASDEALTAFAKRQSGGRDRGVDSLRWLSGEGARAAIEGLKAMMAREGGVDWSPIEVVWAGGRRETVDNPRVRVLEAQWRRLHALGDVPLDNRSALTAWLIRALKHAEVSSPLELAPDDLDRAIRRLGLRLRKKTVERDVAPRGALSIDDAPGGRDG